MTARASAADIIARLQLTPHAEGGHYRETFRDTDGVGGRAFSTSIYYLLKAGEHSHWHRVDAVETWHWYGGDILELSISTDGKTVCTTNLGPIPAGQPQLIVPRHAWQSARPLGEYTLVGCTVSPGFQFSGFELAPAGWKPA
jgi:predicted cupin superfamily sugar epimerase